jgi:rhodanese-related sulfurtransferase
MNIAAISPTELADLINSGNIVDLIDVCTPLEYRAVHIEFARNIPLDQLDPAEIMQSRSKADDPLYIICASGNRGQLACEKFHKAGFSQVVNIEGGKSACLETSLPVVRGRKAISLDRQVRMVIGSLVLAGNLLGWLLHPAFYILSTFMGAGLLFAGITDTCALGMLLARMPWNRSKQSSQSICNY